jgi:hypothetical protein
MLDITETDNISQSPFSSPFNIEVYDFNKCYAIKGGRASMILFKQLEISLL